MLQPKRLLMPEVKKKKKKRKKSGKKISGSFFPLCICIRIVLAKKPTRSSELVGHVRV